MEIHAVIMAGGSGTRLWPISRQNMPKQYIALGQGKCMLLQTLERLQAFIPPEKCHIITTQQQHDVMTKTLSTLNEKSLPEIIYEPEGKNTAACITYSALLLKKKFGNHIVCFLLSDSLINGTEAYLSTLETAVGQTGSGGIAENGIIVVGIAPAYPATGYGYIKPDYSSPANDGLIPGSREIYRVEDFVEKPDEKKAYDLFSSGKYLWNSGIVIGQADTILEKVRRHLPGLYNKLYSAVFNNSGFENPAEDDKSAGFARPAGCRNQAGFTEPGEAVKKAYGELESISFDNGVLEKCGDIYAAAGNFSWDDIGSIALLDKIFGSDAEGNTVIGPCFTMDTKASVIYVRVHRDTY